MKSARHLFRHSPLYSMLLAAWASVPPGVVQAQPAKLAQAEFSADFLRQKNGKKLDLSRFSQSNPTPAGTYRTDVYVNRSWIGRTDVVFRTTDAAEQNARPCFDQALLNLIGIDFEKLTPESLARVQAGGTACPRLEELVPGAEASYDNADLQLNLSVPQASIRRSARGYISPEFWDHGINAGILNYSFNAYRSGSNATAPSTSYYLGLNSGANLHEWHFRNVSSITKQSNAPARYQNIANYLQRDIVTWKSQLTIGDAFTSGQLFDSFGFRGIRLASDDRMLPDSQAGYAPVVRGVAKSNARVRILQNGNLLYETTVSPGPFEVSDLYATGYGGDLTVQVTEADGSQSSFVVPYASLVQLLRPGNSRYNLTAGKTRSADDRTNLHFMQTTYERGITNNLTVFGGAIAAQDYLSVAGGAGFNTPVGAMSLSLTQSHAKVTSQDIRDGQSARAEYSKLMEATGTNFSLAAYRYSSSGFMRLQDLQAAKSLASGNNPGSIRQDRQRHQLQLTVNQALGERYGSLYATATSQNYWNRPGSNTQFQAGYNNTWGRLSYSLSVSRQRDQLSGNTSNQYYVTVSIPLGQERHSPTLSSTMARDNNKDTSLSSTLNGTAGDDNAMSYGATVTKNPNSSNASVNAQYHRPYATFGGSYSYGSGNTTQMSAQISGGMVLHGGGVTFSQALGETIGLIEAIGAENAAINTAGVRIDGRGYAVVPYLTAYRLNEVAIDPKGTSTDVELTTTSQRVAPHAGAVVLMKYGTVSGRSVLIQSRMSNGESLPFGAEVLDEQGNVVGMAGQGGSVFVRTTTEDSGKLLVRWGSKHQDRCIVHYQLPPRDKDAKGIVYDKTRAACEPLPAVAPGTKNGDLSSKKASTERLQ